MSNKAVSLHNIGFAYNDHVVLHDLNLTLSPGTITCILGPSGCGKTTLLQLCASLLQPQTGAVSSSFTRPGPAIGYMQQNGGLLPWLTVSDNILLGLELLGKKPEYAKAEQALKQVGLAGYGDKLPSSLSGGQQQRVALARQLVMQPKLLLLDEPLGALDIVLRQELAQLIKDVVKANDMAALVVTHSPDEAIFLADHLCLLGGKPATITHYWDMTTDISPQTAFYDVVKAMHESMSHG